MKIASSFDGVNKSIDEITPRTLFMIGEYYYIMSNHLKTTETAVAFNLEMNYSEVLPIKTVVFVPNSYTIESITNAKL